MRRKIRRKRKAIKTSPRSKMRTRKEARTKGKRKRK